MNIPGGKASSPGLDIDLAAEVVEVPDKFRRYFRALMLETFMSTPEEFVTWIIDRVAAQGIPVSIGQILGFAGFQFQTSTVVNDIVSVSSTSYANTDGLGPELTGLADGQYAVFLGAEVIPITGSPYMSVAVNGVSQGDDGGLHGDGGFTIASLSRVSLVSLVGENNNTITAQYRSGNGASCQFQRRWLVAVKYSNL